MALYNCKIRKVNSKHRGQCRIRQLSSIYCYVDSLPHPVTLQTAYANTQHSPDIRPNCMAYH